MDNKAVVLLSGGLDSTTTLAIAKKEGFSILALSFDYGQRHDIEIRSARKIAAASGVLRHIVAKIDLREFGGSALTSDLEVPKKRSVIEMSREIPATCSSGPEHDLPFLRSGVGRDGRLERHLHRSQRPRLQRISRLPSGIHQGVSNDGRSCNKGRRRKTSSAYDSHSVDHALESADYQDRIGVGRRLLVYQLLLRSLPGRRSLRRMRCVYAEAQRIFRKSP